MVGRKPYLSNGPATHATGTPCTTSDRGRLGPMLTVVTTFSLLGSNSRATRPSHPSVPTLIGSQVCQMSIARKWDRGDAVQDGELLVIPELLQRRHVVRDAIVLVEVHDLVVGNPHRLPVVPVQRVVIGDHRVQIVVSAGELQNNYYGVFLRRLCFWHDITPFV